MIPTDSVGLALSVISGAVKLAGRLDVLLAEQAAVTADLALPLPRMRWDIPPELMLEKLQGLLDAPPENDAELLSRDAKGIADAIRTAQVSMEAAERYYWKYFPLGEKGSTIDLDADFLAEVARKRPGWDMKDPTVYAAAFYLAPGQDERRNGYVWRISMAAVDVLAEFGAENSALFLRNPRVQGVVGAVLRRFADADVDQATSWNALLRSALSATLNGALDQAATLGKHDRWLAAVLDAVSSARGDDDDFVIGLFQGEGYPRLVASLLDAGARRLSPGDEAAWKSVAAAVLKAGAEQLEAHDGFGDFFQEHWSDLLRAGLGATRDHAAALLGGDRPVLQDLLVSLTTTLASAERPANFDAETLYALADASIRVVAKHPELLAKVERRRAWVGGFAKEILGTVAEQGIQTTISPEGYQALIRKALAFAGDHPEILGTESSPFMPLIGSILGAVSATKTFDAESLAEAAISAALAALERNPFGLDEDFADIVAKAAGSVATLVKSGDLSIGEGRGIAEVVTDVLLSNPGVFSLAKGKLAEYILQSVVKLSKGDSRKLLAGASIVAATRSLLDVAARRGQTLADRPNLETALFEVLEGGLQAAQGELGTRLAAGQIPDFLASFLDAWIAKKLKSLNPAAKTFVSALDDILEALPA